MRESTAKNIKFESIEDLFGTPREFDENTISMVPLKNLYPFYNHPYRVKDDEKMMELVESIKENGVLEPAIVRLRALGGYEIISGHRRKRACELAESLGVECKVLHTYVMSIVKETGESIEAVARRERYKNACSLSYNIRQAKD